VLGNAQGSKTRFNFSFALSLRTKLPFGGLLIRFSRVIAFFWLEEEAKNTDYNGIRAFAPLYSTNIRLLLMKIGPNFFDLYCLWPLFFELYRVIF
jgi:hypothetical protein